MRSLEIEARCKINLGLEVIARRPDGYHEIDTVFQTVSLADSLRIAPNKGGAIALEVLGGTRLPAGPTNLAWRAAEAFLAATGVPGALITLEKRIPVAAGLGGGSADAAAVIVGLNAVYGLGMSADALRGIALTVGSDVPFLIEGGTARGRGRGELLEPLPPPPGCWFVLATPAAEVSAAAAYAAARIGLTERLPSISLVCSAIQEGDAEGLARVLRNDLQTGVVEMCPEVGRLEGLLRERGAMGTVMSGSGPTVFGMVPDRENAERIADSLGGEERRVHVVQAVGAACVLRWH
ncbi:MAG: 4-(cytidine 5'-diphospho)-2-C-methyl-D-erythritol kinase [Candidatus Eisenbacteria bacterium]|nr:4-(cytidine 5'-diphospho)-2-C-methyl-D-erythritol kinase [Candidatus Eisenbacteria bacterium]